MKQESINPPSQESIKKKSKFPEFLRVITTPINAFGDKIMDQKEQWQSQLKKGRDFFNSKFEKLEQGGLSGLMNATSNLNEIVDQTNISKFEDLNIPRLNKQLLLQQLDTQFRIEGQAELTTYHEELAYLDEMLTSFRQYYNSLLDNQSGYEDINKLNPSMAKDTTFASQLQDVQELVVAYTAKYTELSSALAEAREPYLPYTIGASDRLVNPGQMIEDTIGLDNTYDTNKLERQSIEYHQEVINYYTRQGIAIPEANSDYTPNPTTVEEMLQKSVNQVAWMKLGNQAEIEFNTTLSSDPNVLAVVNAPRYSTLDNVEKMDALVIGRSEGLVSEIPQEDVAEIKSLLSELMTINYLKNTLLAVDYPEFNVEKVIKQGKMNAETKEQLIIDSIDFEAQSLLSMTRKSIVRGARDAREKDSKKVEFALNANGEVFLVGELKKLIDELNAYPEDIQGGDAKKALLTKISELKLLIGYSEGDYESLFKASQFQNPLLRNQALPLSTRPLANMSIYSKGGNILLENSGSIYSNLAQRSEAKFYEAYNKHLEAKIAEEIAKVENLDLTKTVNKILDKLKINNKGPRKAKGEEITTQLRERMKALIPLKYSFDHNYLKSYCDPTISTRLNKLLRKHNLTAQAVQLKEKIDPPVIAKFNKNHKINKSRQLITSKRDKREVDYSGLMSTQLDPLLAVNGTSSIDQGYNYGIFLGFQSPDRAYATRVNSSKRKTMADDQARSPLSNKPLADFNPPVPIPDIAKTIEPISPPTTPAETIPLAPVPAVTSDISTIIPTTPEIPIAVVPTTTIPDSETTPSSPILTPPKSESTPVIDDSRDLEANPATTIEPPTPVAAIPDKPILRDSTPTPIPEPTLNRPIITTPASPVRPSTTVTNTTRPEARPQDTELKFAKRINTPEIKVDYNNLNTLKNYPSSLSPINQEIKTVIYQGLLNTFEVGLNSIGEVVAYDKSGNQCLVTINDGNLIVVPEGLEKGYNLSMKRYVVRDIFSKLSK
jgi:hypothetical protein